METNNNMKDFNIAEILKYAPKGLKLYSPLLGEVRLEKVSDHDDTIVVTTKYKSERVFFEDGKYDSNGECLLFPSVNHRCWNHWQNTLFLESIGSVCVDTITGNKFILGEDGTYFGDNTGNSYHFLIDDEDSGNYLLNSRYATPEETKEFFEELEKNGYKWDGKMVVEKEQNKQKFKVGDWIIRSAEGFKHNTYLIKEVKDYYVCEELKGRRVTFTFDDVHKNFKLWDILDAKDGDVLACNEEILLFKSYSVQGRISVYCWYNWKTNNFHSIGVDDASLTTRNKIYPATKEQRDILFAKMKEEGYEWDDDTKKLIKTTIPKFKVGDIVKFDRPSATVKREILSIDFENERYLTRRTDIGGAIKEFIYFCEQDDYVIVGSHNSLSNLSIEVKVSALADEIIALKERVKALEIQAIKQCSDKNRLDSLESKMIILDSHNINNRLDALESRVFPIPEIYKSSDKAGDCVTLKDMKS